MAELMLPVQANLAG